MTQNHPPPAPRSIPLVQLDTPQDQLQQIRSEQKQKYHSSREFKSYHMTYHMTIIWLSYDYYMTYHMTIIWLIIWLLYDYHMTIIWLYYTILLSLTDPNAAQPTVNSSQQVMNFEYNPPSTSKFGQVPSGYNESANQPSTSTYDVFAQPPPPPESQHRLPPLPAAPPLPSTGVKQTRMVVLDGSNIAFSYVFYSRHVPICHELQIIF